MSFALRRPRSRARNRLRLVDYQPVKWISSMLLVLGFSSISAAQVDPIKNFCRRFGHQTAVIDRKLYIDGGFVNYNAISQNPKNYSNLGLLYHDLDVLGSAGMPQLYANLTKNSSIPSVNGGALWADDVNKRLYLFGGEYHQQPPPPVFTLWSFDVLGNEWVSFGTPAETGINGVSYGAGISVPERGEAYYYGGWMSGNSVPGWDGPAVATSRLVKYSMDTNVWANITGPDNVRRAEGVMLFLPIGDGGMLVYFGGIQDRYANGTVSGQPMEQIFLYDVLSSKWYIQNATGDVPDMRARFCAGATWASDQSSYNIYIYGGAGMPPNTAGFDDVYILTIPSFKWIKIFPSGDGTGQYPHHSLSCNIISGAQMIIIGGTFPLTTQCDVPDQFGAHNLDLGLQSPDRAPWKLFLPNLTQYAVPPPVISVIGGYPNGGATKTAPAGGFSNPDLSILMTRRASIAIRTPTRAIPDPTGGLLVKQGGRLSNDAIAGIVVGSVLSLLFILGVLVRVIRKHRQRRAVATITRVNKASDGTVEGGARGAPWSPATTAGFTPTSPPPGSPFLTRQAAAELEVAGERPYRAADGTVYELVTSRTGSSGVAGSSGNGYGGSDAVQTKVDSEGRVWVRVPLMGLGLGSGVGGSPIRREPGTPASSVGAAMPMSSAEPHELPGPETRGEMIGSIPTFGPGHAGYGRPRHTTFYHP